MVTPELQQYILQQRSAGLSDIQIRQNLYQQGWSASDLDEAFGVSSNSSGGGMGGKIIRILIIVFLVFAILSSIAGFFFWYIAQRFVSEVFNSKYNNNSQTSTSQSSQQSSSGSQAYGYGSCDQAPPPAAMDAYVHAMGVAQPGLNLVTGSTYPSSFPTFPLYSNAKAIEYISYDDKQSTPNRTGFMVFACSTDDISLVEKYFDSINLSGTGWQNQTEAMQNLTHGLPNPFSQMPAGAPRMYAFMKGGFPTTKDTNPENGMVVSVTKGSGVTIIYYQYLAK